MKTLKIATFGILSTALVLFVHYKYILLLASSYVVFIIIFKTDITELEGKWTAAGISLIVNGKLKLVASCNSV